MTTPIAPIICSPDIARILGADLCLDPGEGFVPAAMAVAIIDAVRRIGARGDIAVLTHGRGSVWVWRLQRGARDTGAGF